MKLCLALSLVFLGGVLATPRVKREACEEAQTNYDACVASAHLDHREALSGGDDGKPDFYSRKSCNFIEAAVMTCGDLLLGDCFPEESIQQMRNQQFESIVASLEQSDEWDSDKCPSVKKWKDQMSGDDEEDDTDGAGEEDNNEETEDESATENEGEDGSEGEDGEGAAEEDGENGEEDETEGDANEDGDAENESEDGEENGEDGDGDDGEDGEDDAESSAATYVVYIPLLIAASLY